MTDEQALLKAIADQPDEDTPRLAFADWLQEQGNPFDTSWASVIRAQVRLASVGPGEERTALEEAVRVVGSPYWRNRWLARLALQDRPRIWGTEWDRGFLAEVRGHFASIRRVRGSAPWIARVPVRRLNIEVADSGQFDELLAWPELRPLHSLHVTFLGPNTSVGDDQAASVAGCAALAGLRSLYLAFVTVGDRGAADLLDSIHLRGVRELALVWDLQAGGALSRGVRKRLTDRFGPHCLR